MNKNNWNIKNPKPHLCKPENEKVGWEIEAVELRMKTPSPNCNKKWFFSQPLTQEALVGWCVEKCEKNEDEYSRQSGTIYYWELLRYTRKIKVYRYSYLKNLFFFEEFLFKKSIN